GVSEGVSAAVLKALSKRPEERYGSCREFVQALIEGAAKQNDARVRIKTPSPQGTATPAPLLSAVPDVAMRQASRMVPYAVLLGVLSIGSLLVIYGLKGHAEDKIHVPGPSPKPLVGTSAGGCTNAADFATQFGDMEPQFQEIDSGFTRLQQAYGDIRAKIRYVPPSAPRAEAKVKALSHEYDQQNKTSTRLIGQCTILEPRVSRMQQALSSTECLPRANAKLARLYAIHYWLADNAGKRQMEGQEFKEKAESIDPESTRTVIQSYNAVSRAALIAQGKSGKH
ncbi:MAG: hypothetical protein JWL77_3330, partial [Chthonomonadaceae bacterium]|nr:hypothetical protein [Chthonomonadaceae bacterium]